MPCLQDIRDRARPLCTCINGSLFFAFLSALVSSIDTVTGHASPVNGALLRAAHWILVVLLAIFYVHPTACATPHAEPLWLAYGFLLGEMDSDSIVAWCLIAISAVLYLGDQRKRRTESVNIMPAAEDPVSDDDAAAI